MRRTSPFMMGIIYSIMGILFTYIAIGSASTNETVWNFTTVLIIVVATFDFGVAIRMFSLHSKIKKMTKK